MTNARGREQALGEANHARRNGRPRQTELLDGIADQLKDVLAARRR